MKTPALICLTFFLQVISGFAILSPVPVVTIESIKLPQVELRISNPSKTDECRIWEGMSWEEQNKWFALRRAGGGKTVEIRRKRESYTMNFPVPRGIPAGGSVILKYNLAGDWWERPKNFAPRDWKFEIQAHLDIPRGIDAHCYGVFMGRVTSPWYNVDGREIEAAGKPVLDERMAAIESRKDFPWDQLIALLEKWNAGTLSDKKSLADFFGSDFSWDGLEACHSGNAWRVALPEQGTLEFTFHISLPPLEKQFPPEKVRYGYHGNWVDAADALQKTRARLVRRIVLTRRTNRFTGSLTTDSPLFRRAFDWKGRIDPKATKGP
ncbi:MAG TPA: hypothetical protein VG796_08740 [Verrucomicrobiales bacterium]|nr:hypothetical protein [Verrucomicrobiales bacterium]